jgi:hypothetical protein
MGIRIAAIFSFLTREVALAAAIQGHKIPGRAVEIRLFQLLALIAKQRSSLA